MTDLGIEVPREATSVGSSEPSIPEATRAVGAGSDRGGARTLRRYLPTMLIVLGILALWEFLPKIDWLANRYRFLDPFFISSPEKVGQAMYELVTGTGGRPSVWPYLWQTVIATLYGVAIGTLLGMLVGLWLSSSPRASSALQPILNFFNSMPRIALIPIFVILFGPTTTTSVITAAAVVFFVAFFPAYAGGKSAPGAMRQNALLLGASRWQVTRRIRAPYVVVWSSASLPNAVSFGLVAVVTAEILTGTKGMGQLIYTSISIVDSTLTFAVAILLGVVGAVMVAVTRRMTKPWLRWWEAQNATP